MRGRPLAVATRGAEEGRALGLRESSSGEEAWKGAWLQCEQLSPERQVWVAPLDEDVMGQKRTWGQESQWTVEEVRVSGLVS